MSSAIELRHGRWQDVLADVECDALITDPPYSERTHTGQRSVKTSAWHANPEASQIEYGHVTELDVIGLVAHWLPRTKRWFVMFGDHQTVRWAVDAMDSRGWYTFHPIPWIKPDAAPRISGDGPSPQSESIAIGRPKRRMRAPELRFRPGFYKALTARDGAFVGTKPGCLMRALVRDYSEPGDLVVDPYAGSATTLLSAAMEGRRALGAEMDAGRYAIAQKRIARGYTPGLFAAGDI